MKDAVIALGMGGPDGPDSVEPFLRNLLSDREIINFGIGGTLQNLLATFIAKRRAKSAIEKYALMGGGSPQLDHSKAMLQKVSLQYKELTGRQLDYYVGMCYWHPFIEDTVQKMAELRYRSVFLFPMYPQYSTTTSGACFNRYNKAISLRPPAGRIVRINSFHMYLPFLVISADRIKAAAAKLDTDIKNVHILFSAHSLPRSVVESGDPYENQIHEQASTIAGMITPGSYSVAFQSKLGRQKWLEPSVINELHTLAAKGIKKIVTYPISFINDHIETLVELDVELQEHAKHLGVDMVRADTFNSSDDFAGVVTKLLAGL